MKKRIAKLLVALGMLATASASVGCLWWAMDEPKALKEMDTRIQIFDMEEMILLLNANLGERWYADFERLKSNFMKEMS